VKQFEGAGQSSGKDRKNANFNGHYNKGGNRARRSVINFGGSKVRRKGRKFERKADYI